MKAIRLAAIVALSAFALRAELVGTLRVDVQGTATNSTGISGGALTTVGGIVVTSTVANATAATRAVTVTGGQSNIIATAVQPAALGGYLALTNSTRPTIYGLPVFKQADSDPFPGAARMDLWEGALYGITSLPTLLWGTKALYGDWTMDSQILATRTYSTTNAAAAVAAHAAAADPHADRAYAAGLVSAAPAWQSITNLAASIIVTNLTERPYYLYSTGAVSIAFAGLRSPQPLYLVVRGPTSATFPGAHFVGGASWQTNASNHFIAWQYGTNLFINPVTTSED